MTDISKEMAVQLARGCGLTSPDLFKLSVRQASIEEIQSLCQVAYKLGRKAGLDEAKKKCDAEVAEFHSSNESRNTAEYLAAAIESLKDNTP